jgi:hypothetical protein
MGETGVIGVIGVCRCCGCCRWLLPLAVAVNPGSWRDVSVMGTPDPARPMPPASRAWQIESGAWRIRNLV